MKILKERIEQDGISKSRLMLDLAGIFGVLDNNNEQVLKLQESLPARLYK